VIQQMLEELLKAGADINAAEPNGLATPLMMALLQKKLPVAKLLLGGWSRVKHKCRTLMCNCHATAWMTLGQWKVCTR
jgi:hypothetical protein